MSQMSASTRNQIIFRTKVTEASLSEFTEDNGKLLTTIGVFIAISNYFINKNIFIIFLSLMIALSLCVELYLVRPNWSRSSINMKLFSLFFGSFITMMVIHISTFFNENILELFNYIIKPIVVVFEHVNKLSSQISTEYTTLVGIVILLTFSLLVVMARDEFQAQEE